MLTNIIYFYKGESDPLVHLSWAKETSISLLLKGVDIEFNEYKDIEHNIGEEQVYTYIL